MRRFLSAALLVSLTGIVPISDAPAQSVSTLIIGQTKAGSPGSKVNLYRFGGTTGTTVSLDLTAPGAAALTIYAPSGEEMLSARGIGMVALEVILPLSDIYYVGVLRESAAQGYSLKSSAVESDQHLAYAAESVGYTLKWASGYSENQCWIDPGNILRVTGSKGLLEEITIGRGGNFYHKNSKDGRTATFSSNRRIEDDKIITTYKSPSGQTKVMTEPLVTAPEEVPALTFSSYLCK